MKQGSTLNPYAEAYVPIAKRQSEPENHSKDSGKSEQHGQVDYYTQSKLASVSLYSEPSQIENEVAEELRSDEQVATSLEYLKMEFPGLANESIYEAYMFNRSDLEATIDMLQQLEFHEDESVGTLPDTLDIGDVSESDLSAHLASQKLKNVHVAPKGSSDSAGSSQVIS